MGKKKTNETKEVEESQIQSGTFTTFFSDDVANGETSGFASLFSDDNPFRRKKLEPKSQEIIENKPNVDNGGEETVSLEKTKRSKKEKKLKSPIADSGEEEEMETDVKDSKRKMFI
ncbi:unnamed protein product [Cochlearia groenlandica]